MTRKIKYHLFRHFSVSKPKRKPVGQIPGTAIHTGEKKMDDVLITLHEYSESDHKSREIKSPDEITTSLESHVKSWIQVRGLHDVEKLKPIWNHFDMHPLIQEDIVNTSQRPKIEPYDDMVFIVMRVIMPQDMPEVTEKKKKGSSPKHRPLHSEQIAIIVTPTSVITFQESETSLLEPVVKRLISVGTRLRKNKPDYLTYAIVDTVVDYYFQALDVLSEEIELLEEKIIHRAEEHDLQRIHALRRDLIYFRKSVWSMRDGLNSLIRDESKIIHKDTKVFFRDVYDHIVQVIDSIENHRELVFSLYDIYMSGLSIKMNEVMKVLTIIATIFIPLTFIVGIYGMNFDPDSSPWNMPELGMYYGYPASLLFMLLVSLGMLYFFRRRGW
ncbi:MAG: magnesium/cobalt transporter CorA, partial [Balneolia bacterium]|nr:magnesium/cobalt transporter CorA [Balneolia bacterium]